MKIVIGRCPINLVEGFLTDSWLYNELQSKTVEQIGDGIMSDVYGDIHLHTFNVLLLNYLKDDFAREYVYFYSYSFSTTNNYNKHLYHDVVENSLQKCFDIENINRKLEVMGVGEAIADSWVVMV